MNSSNQSDYRPPNAGRSPAARRDAAAWREATGRALVKILRHKAVEMKLDIGPDGFIPLDQVLGASTALRHTTLGEIQEVVRENDKQRFLLKEVEGTWFIRANQGHSIKTMEESELFTPVTSSEGISLVVHGTY